MGVARNAPCACGSGKKYKHCCALKSQKIPLTSRIVYSLIGLMLLGGAIIALVSLGDAGSDTPGPRRVWSEEHQHWH